MDELTGQSPLASEKNPAPNIDCCLGMWLNGWPYTYSEKTRCRTYLIHEDAPRSLMDVCIPLSTKYVKFVIYTPNRNDTKIPRPKSGDRSTHRRGDLKKTWSFGKDIPDTQKSPPPRIRLNGRRVDPRSVNWFPARRFYTCVDREMVDQENNTPELRNTRNILCEHMQLHFQKRKHISFECRILLLHCSETLLELVLIMCGLIQNKKWVEGRIPPECAVLARVCLCISSKYLLDDSDCFMIYELVEHLGLKDTEKRSTSSRYADYERKVFRLLGWNMLPCVL
jgi:hypothetical protein